MSRSTVSSRKSKHIIRAPRLGPTFLLYKAARLVWQRSNIVSGGSSTVRNPNQVTINAMLISTPSKMMTSQMSREARRVGGNTSMITTRAALVVGVQGLHSGRTGGHASSSTPEQDQTPEPGVAGDVSWLCWGAVVCCEANPPVVWNKTNTASSTTVSSTTAHRHRGGA